MLPSEKDGVHIWLSLIESIPSTAMAALRKIKEGTAEIVTRGRQTTREPFTADMCFNGERLAAYILHDFGCAVNDIPAQSRDDISLLNLGVRLEQMLHTHSNSEEAPGLYSILMEGPIPKGLRRNEDKVHVVSTEMVAEHIWRALIILDWSRALSLMESIYHGDAYFKATSGAPDPILFSRIDVHNAAKLEYFLSGLTDPFYIDELTRRVPAGQAGDFHREFMTFAFKRCTAEQKEQFHEMFFGRSPSPEIEKSNPPRDHSDLVEMIPTPLSKVFNDFIECGKQLGIPATTLAILLPDQTRKQIQLEIFEQLSK